MAGIWIFSEDVLLAKQLLGAGLTLAGKLNKPLRAFCLQEEEAAGLIACGATEVCVLEGANAWFEGNAAPLAQLAADERPDIVLIGATLRGKDLAAKVAASLDAGLVTDAIDVDCTNEAMITKRMMYGGLAVCTEEQAFPALATIPPRTYDAPAEDAARQGQIKSVPVKADARVLVDAVCPVSREGADLTKADKVVGVGLGLKMQDDMELVRDLAAVLVSDIGCTRSIAEDYHWLPSEAYIGLSGQKIKPQLYFAVGVSGQIQHIAGVRDAATIVAVDTNENAPIFAAADYGIVGDLYQIIPALIAAVQSRK